MSDPILFDDKGQRVTSWIGDSLWRHYGPRRPMSGQITVPDETMAWRPARMAVRCSRRFRNGWRVFDLDVGVIVGKVRRDRVDQWWRSADQSQKRFPTVAALEMYVRMTA